jgi:PHS family inorganic phosphate transporter-like MFS transporter
MHEITPTKSLTPSAQYQADLEELERHDGRPAFMLTMAEVKLLGIAGVRLLSQIFCDRSDALMINRWASFWMVKIFIPFIFLDVDPTLLFSL